MKTLTIILTLSFFSIQLSAQRIVEESMPVSSNQEIRLDFDFADDIFIKAWDKSEVYVKATVNINEGKDNNKFKFISRKGFGYISIKSEIEDLNKLSTNCRTIIIKNGDTTIINGMGAQINLTFEVFMPPDVELALETINGNIEIKGLTGPMEIETINGEIDLYISSDHKADLSMSTINGTMYTNLDPEFISEKDNMCKVGGDVDTKLNGGGVDIDLETINGTIYLRKAK
ncbi:MAG: hypothetical protein ISS18_11585 [Bacteroidales bacterium]|nr:hypothetical protein [Bacteroidales bacterium]